MITDFTDRRPALSAVLITLLYTAVPGAFLLAAGYASGGSWNVEKIVVAYALVLQVILWRKVERPILILLPFLLALLGFIVSEIVYTVSLGSAPVGVGPSPLAFLLSSALVILFGSEAAGCVGGLLVYGLIVIVRKVREILAER